MAFLVRCWASSTIITMPSESFDEISNQSLLTEPEDTFSLEPISSSTDFDDLMHGFTVMYVQFVPCSR